jgi:Fe-S cluster assembly ATPase SufC
MQSSSTTTLLHVIGPQGSGKSTLARWIVAGAAVSHQPLQGVHVDMDVARFKSNADLRSQYPGALVVVEAEEVGVRHQDLARGDFVLLLSRG